MLILKAEPMKFTAVIHMEGRLKVRWVFKGACVQMHTSRVVISLKTYGGAAQTAEVSEYTLGAFKRIWFIASPFKIL